MEQSSVVFVYCQGDRKAALLAQQMVGQLNGMGVVTFDPFTDIMPGQRNEDVSSKKIHKAQYVFILFSHLFFDKGGLHWTLLNVANDVRRMLPHDRIFVIPIIVDNCRERYDHGVFRNLRPLDISERATPEHVLQLLDDGGFMVPGR